MLSWVYVAGMRSGALKQGVRVGPRIELRARPDVTSRKLRLRWSGSSGEDFVMALVMESLRLFGSPESRPFAAVLRRRCRCRRGSRRGREEAYGPGHQGRLRLTGSEACFNGGHRGPLTSCSGMRRTSPTAKAARGRGGRGDELGGLWLTG